MKKILIFGDSLTAGYGLPLTEAYPSIIQTYINEAGYNTYQVVNAGLSGDTTANGNHRLDKWLSESIAVFVLALGVNDGLRGIPTRETSINLQTMIDKAKRAWPNASIILSGMEIPDIFPGRYAAEFRVLFRELAVKNNIGFIPFLLEGVAGIRELNLHDGLHPNAKGQKILAQHTWKVLKDYL
jgi:acyl-CoA thioesterase I